MSVNAQRLIGFLFFSQTLFLASTFRTWNAVCIVMCLAGAVIWLGNRRSMHEPSETPSRLPRWFRWSLLGVTFGSILGITAAWRWASQVGESINPIYVAVDVLAHAAFFSALVVWSLRPGRGHVSMLPLGLTVVLLCVAAGGASQSVAAQTTVALAACLGFTLASQILLSAERGSGGTIFVHDRDESGRSAWLGPLFSMLTLSILLMATSAIANATSYVLPSIQEKLQKQLQASFDAVAAESHIGGTRYVRGSTLGVIRHHMLGDPNEIALRIHADVSPGYLRGHAFDLYQRRHWYSADSRNFPGVQSVKDRNIAPSSTGTTKLSRQLNRALERFLLTEQSREKTITLEIHNDPLKGQLVFLPLTTRWVEARSSELVVSNHGIVRHGVDVSKPYVAGVGQRILKEQLDPERRQVLLQVPESISRQTNRVVEKICARLPTPASKAAAVSEFFQREFSYSLTSTKPPRRVDPLSFFLETKHAAHCEYFASATVLVLRSAGVPARYVTGYVADEFSAEEEMWVARNNDAHAWAEAYDDATGQWFPVESTPGRTYHTVDPNENIEQAASFFGVFGGDDAGDSDSLFSRALGWLLSTRATAPLLLVFRIGQLPLFCVLVYLLWSRYLKPSRSEVDPIDQQSRRMLRKVDRLLRRHALVRRPSETPYQFADRIEVLRRDPSAPLSGQAEKQLSGISQWYRDYANARYQGKLPTPLG